MPDSDEGEDVFRKIMPSFKQKLNTNYETDLSVVTPVEIIFIWVTPSTTIEG